MNFLGVNFTIFFTTFLSLLIVIIIKIKNNKKDFFWIFLIIVALVSANKSFFDITNQYGNIKIINSKNNIENSTLKDGIYLSINESASSFIPKGKSEYFEYIKKK